MEQQPAKQETNSTTIWKTKKLLGTVESDQQRLSHKLFGHNYCSAIVKVNNDKENIKRRLIGKVNKERIQIGNTRCDALLDSGSVISSISEDFYRKHCSDVPLKMIHDLFDGTFTITSASGNQLSILGYIEINVSLPGLSRPVPSLIMVLADSILNEKMPALIGSNILEVWKDALIRDDTNLPMVINNKVICAAVTQAEVISIPMAVVTSQHPCSNSISSQHFSSTSSAVGTKAHADKDDFVKLFNRDAWPAAYRNQLEDLLWKNRDVFATSHHELGKCDITKHEILLSDYTPIKQKYRRIAPHLFDSVKEELRKLHESGVIRPSMSPWASPVSVSLKKDGSPRICLDLRKVNTVTKKDAKSVPNVQEMFDMLHGKRVFSSLDLYSGFHQIELEESSKEITAFTCGPLGFWEMNRLPFGACNSSATFQRTMEAVLGDLLYSTSLVYVDDIIIHSTNESQHIDNLDKVFSRLLQHGLRLKPSKCTFYSSR